MALFDGNSESSKITGSEPINREAQVKDELSQSLWDQVDTSDLSEERKTSLQATIDKIVGYKMEERKPVTTMEPLDLREDPITEMTPATIDGSYEIDTTPLAEEKFDYTGVEDLPEYTEPVTPVEGVTPASKEINAAQLGDTSMIDRGKEIVQTDFSNPISLTQYSLGEEGYDFVAGNEGGAIEGYVPQRNGVAMGVSGVTIATGLDLGQQSEASLRGMGFTEEEITNLSPYLGLQQEEAIDYLAKNPLSITQEDADTWKNRVFDAYEKKAAGAWEANMAEGGTDWYDLTESQRTVAYDVFYQHGVGKSGKAKDIKEAIYAEDWDRAKSLMEESEMYATRNQARSNLI